MAPLLTTGGVLGLQGSGAKRAGRDDQDRISQQTAAELIYRRANAALPLMGMQSCDKKGELAVRKSDVSVAKNYLTEDEMKLLGLLVEQVSGLCRNHGAAANSHVNE